MRNAPILIYKTVIAVVMVSLHDLDASIINETTCFWQFKAIRTLRKYNKNLKGSFLIFKMTLK